MSESIPSYISILFILVTFITIYVFYKAAGDSKTVLIILLAWTGIQGIIGYTGFYLYEMSLPPRFALLVLPPVVVIILLFIFAKGRTFIDDLDIKLLTYLQTVRIFVEIILFLLYENKQIPELMTFEGRNYDIISGLTAPFVAYLGFTRKVLNRQVILVWNLICLILVMNIVINAALSVQSPLQKFAFDQPNIGVLYFPFVWLPCCIVPLVILAHLASLRQLLSVKKN